MDEEIVATLQDEYPENMEDISVMCSLIDAFEDAPEEQRSIMISDAQQKKDYLENINNVDVLDDVQVLINDLRSSYEIRVDGNSSSGTSHVL